MGRLKGSAVFVNNDAAMFKNFRCFFAVFPLPKGCGGLIN